MINGTKCDYCGKFMKTGETGSSWAQSWGYDMAGEANLYEPRFRCKKCTEKHGAPNSNCGGHGPWSGVIGNEYLSEAIDK